MTRMHLYIQAPFAVARPFVAGWYRPTAGFLSHSSVYGLLLNIAGIESRLWEHHADHDGKTPTSLIRENAEMPRFQLALGIPCESESERVETPGIQTLYQQLHNYPVGASAAIPDEWAKGRKNNIQPVRREVLTEIRAIVAIGADAPLIGQIRSGLRGDNRREYGLPFLGDNSFLIDRLEEIDTHPARWYERIEGESGRPRPGTTRLTVWIDRANMSRTISHLYAPSESATVEPSDEAWTSVGPPTNDN